MNPCATCGDSGKERNRALDGARSQAKLKAVEEKTAQAICKEETDGTLFIVPVGQAFTNHFLIEEVVSGLSD